MHLHFDRSNELRVTSLRVIEPPMEDLLSPISKSKKHDFFVTSRNLQSNINQIQKHHNKLNNFIDDLQSKVNKKVEKSEAQIIIAYKNHLVLVKKDLEELKKETQAHSSNSNNYEEQINYLQKKLVVFRDQSLRLFERLVQKDKEIEEIKYKNEEMLAEKKYRDESVKALTKRNKQLQIQLSQMENKISQEEVDYTHKFDISLLGANALRNKSYRHKNRTVLTSANISKAISSKNNVTLSRNAFGTTEGIEQNQSSENVQLFVKKLKAKLDYIDKDLLNQVARIAGETFLQIQRKSVNRTEFFQRGKSKMERATRISMRSKSNYTVDYADEPRKITSGLQIHKDELQKQSRKFNNRQQMSGYFAKCVETVKKEITRRKDCNSLSFYTEGNPITYQTFKKIDCYRLMELVLSDEKVIEGVYQLLLSSTE